MRFAPLLVVALVLVGCGASSSPEEAVSDTGAKTADAGTARIAVGFDGAVETSGAFDLEDGTGVLEGNLSTPHTIITADASYERLSDERAMAPITSSKRWLRWEKSVLTPLVLDPIVDSPAELLAFLGFAGEVHEVGSGEERGEPVTRYSAVLDLERFLEGIPPAERADFRDALDDFWPGWATAPPPVQLALDAEGRLRRADLVLGDGSGELAFEFFDYGVKVDATAPPAEEVVTWGEYEELLRKECEALKKKGLETTKSHCVGGCSAGEGEV
jgi:hypothetical protein